MLGRHKLRSPAATDWNKIKKYAVLTAGARMGV